MIKLVLLALLGLVLQTCYGERAFIQIIDFIPQNETEKLDPALVLTETTPSSINSRRQNITIDLFDIKYMESSKKLSINATTYEVSLRRHRDNKVVYNQVLDRKLVLNTGENAVVLVDETHVSNLLKGALIHTGSTPKPGLDEAIVQVCPMDTKRFNDLSKFTVLGTNKMCKGCITDIPLKLNIVGDSVQYKINDTNAEWDVKVYYNNVLICAATRKFGDGGVYINTIKETETYQSSVTIVWQCHFAVSEAATNFWLPIWLPILLLVIFIIVVVLIVVIDRQFPRIREEALKKVGMWNPEPTDHLRKCTRLQSLDTFRGIAVTTMIFVNFGAGEYWFLEHAAWNGMGLADFVFPWFLFMVGVSIVFSIQSQLKRNVAKLEILKKVTIRFLKLFLIGIFLNTGIPGGVTLSTWRIPGVLQRIGFTFFVCGVIEILFIPRLSSMESYGVAGERLTVEDNSYTECGKFLNDNPEKKTMNWPTFSSNEEPACSNKSLLYHTWPQWIIVLILSGMWAAITFAMPVPGCPTGYLGPGGIADKGAYSNCTGGAAGHIDRLIFGKNMYQHPTCKKMYHTTYAYDPEGILGSIMAVLTVYSGVLAGHIIVMNKSSRAGILFRLSILSGICIVAGVILSQFLVPVNKNLWSPSYVLLTSGSSYGILAILYLLIDARGICCGRPFSSVGKNPILIYVGSYILYNYFPFNWATSNTHCALMTQAIVGTVCWILVGMYLDFSNLFFKL